MVRIKYSNLIKKYKNQFNKQFTINNKIQINLSSCKKIILSVKLACFLDLWIVQTLIFIQYSLYNSYLSKMIELSQIHTIIIEGTTLRFDEKSVVIISL
jgi:hypothetical protein